MSEGQGRLEVLPALTRSGLSLGAESALFLCLALSLFGSLLAGRERLTELA
ncbi:MAG: hypothetical protein JKY65_11035 [Planctomycetes bacterium]|nr:hypothetical protein [Planctomycetota bacterium]